MPALWDEHQEQQQWWSQLEPRRPAANAAEGGAEEVTQGIWGSPGDPE